MPAGNWLAQEVRPELEQQGEPVGVRFGSNRAGGPAAIVNVVGGTAL